MEGKARTRRRIRIMRGCRAAGLQGTRGARQSHRSPRRALPTRGPATGKPKAMEGKDEQGGRERLRTGWGGGDGSDDVR